MPNPPQQALVQSGSKLMEYVPFGGQDKVKLTVPIVQNYIAVKTKSGRTCSETDAVKFMALCQARRLNPFEGDCFLIGYDGKDGPSFSLITAHQAFLKRAEVHPEYDGMKSGVVVQPGYTCGACAGERYVTHDQKTSLCPICEGTGLIDEIEGDIVPEEQTLIGGWSKVFFKTRKIPCHKRVLLKRFQKPWGIWQEDPAGMICKVGEADSLRSAFPTMLGGLYLREEVEFIDVKSESVPASPEFLAPPRKPESKPSKPSAEDDIPMSSTDAQSQAEAPQSDTTEPAAPMEQEDCVKFVQQMAKAGNVSEEQVMQYLKEQKVAKSAQNDLRELSASKLQALIGDWKNALPKIAAIQM